MRQNGTGAELLQLLMRERWPSWRAVQNEQAAAAIEAQRQQDRQTRIAQDGDVFPAWFDDNAFMQRRRSQLLDEVLNGPAGERGHARRVE